MRMPANTFSRPSRSSPITPRAGRVLPSTTSSAHSGAVSTLWRPHRRRKPPAAGRSTLMTAPQRHTLLWEAPLFIHRRNGAQALNELTRATELAPQYAPAYHLRAKILCALGRNDEAITIQKQSTAIDPIVHPGAMGESIFASANLTRRSPTDGSDSKISPQPLTCSPMLRIAITGRV